MPEATGSLTQQIIERHDRTLAINYARHPVAMVRGEGVDVYDADGNRYLDLFAGFGAPLLGHCHPDLVAALTDQANRLWHVGNLLHTEPQTRAAEAIARLGFDGRSFFSHSGADANEAAIKLARLYGRANPGPSGPRYGVISATDSFHGRGFATMGATGSPKVRAGYDPLLPGFVNVAYGDAAAVETAIDERTVAVLVEPIQGEGGVIVPGDRYLADLRRLCDRHDLLLILDEVWTGCGRTGKVFAYQHWMPDDAGPDVMTLGKGVGGGLAVGVMCARPGLAALNDARKHGVRHASTLGGNCLAMAVTAKIFEVIQRDSLAEHAARLGDLATGRLREASRRCEAISDVRGRGLFIGIELDPAAPGAGFESAAQVVSRCLRRGVLIGSAQGEVLRLAPPLIITRERLEEGLEVLLDAIQN